MARTQMSPPTPNKPFDATTKELVEFAPRDWLKFLNLPGDECEMISADLATVTTEADRLVRVTSPTPYLAHIELQASFDAGFEKRLLRYNVLADEKYDLPVQSVAVLLRPEAARGSYLTGTLRRRDVQGEVQHWFRYQVVRLWEVPVETVLQGGVALLPLAPIAKVSRRDLPDVVREMDKRIAAETPPQMARYLWTSALILFGLRYPDALAQEVFKGVDNMEESATYQAIIAKGAARGKAEEARRMLLLAGKGRLGAPTKAITKRIDAIVSVERLEALAERIYTVESWNDLLAQG